MSLTLCLFDAIVDFSDEASVHWYGNEIANRQIVIISAISNYSAEGLTLLQKLGEKTRVMYSPNITLGINFLMLAAKLLRKVAPFADVEIIEQHFKEKQDVSGTAKKIAQSLNVNEEKITALRLGGIVGHHEVIFGFPHHREEIFGMMRTVGILRSIRVGMVHAVQNRIGSRREVRTPLPDPREKVKKLFPVFVHHKHLVSCVAVQKKALAE